MYTFKSWGGGFARVCTVITLHKGRVCVMQRAVRECTQRPEVALMLEKDCLHGALGPEIKCICQSGDCNQGQGSTGVRGGLVEATLMTESSYHHTTSIAKPLHSLEMGLRRKKLPAKTTWPTLCVRAWSIAREPLKKEAGERETEKGFF